MRQVLTYVETGNVDAGIVYKTDALISDKVKIGETAATTSHGPNPLSFRRYKRIEAQERGDFIL